MNTRQGMFRLWVVASGLWLLGNGISWYQDFAAERTQVAAIDECTKFYQPLPDGFVLDTPAPKSLLEQFDADSVAVAQEAAEQKLHPHCARNVGSIALMDFIGMHKSDREALRQHSEDAIRASTTATLTRGLAVPTGLLVMGLILGWIIQGFRSA